MDEIENYSESIHEQSNEHAHEILHKSDSKEKWVLWVALSTAVVAVLAAVTGLLAGNHADEGMLDQMHASDQWSFYESRSIKADMLKSTDYMLSVIGKKPDTADAQKLKKYALEQKGIMAKAKDYQAQSDLHTERHDILARAVTLFQAAIAIAAISIITKRRPLWFLSLGFAFTGLFFLLQELFF